MPSRLSLSSTIYERIRDDVVSGVLRAGERLTEPALVERYSASRTPVREALRLLESEGALTRLAPGSVMVPHLSWADARDLYETRAVLEGLVARQLAGHVPPAEVAGLHSGTKKIRIAAEAGDAESSVYFSSQFHQRLIELSGNGYVARSLSAYQTNIARYRRFSSVPEATVDSLVQDALEHQHILDMILANDADQAEAVVRAHILGGLKRIEAGLRSDSQSHSDDGAKSP